ncbi:MAG: hypothetical protein JNJ70_04520 [Verrucomicrobiales bacterium]|nr:hypothetical protein [Verrucomicrobiales bacterium]
MNCSNWRSFAAFGIDLRLAPLCGSEANLRKSVLICVETHSFSIASKEFETTNETNRTNPAYDASCGSNEHAIRFHSLPFASIRVEMSCADWRSFAAFGIDLRFAPSAEAKRICGNPCSSALKLIPARCIEKNRNHESDESNESIAAMKAVDPMSTPIAKHSRPIRFHLR